MTHKQCTQCGHIKALSDFTLDKRKKHGVGGRCRDCKRLNDRERNRRKSKDQEYLAKRIAQQRKYYYSKKGQAFQKQYTQKVTAKNREGRRSNIFYVNCYSCGQLSVVRGKEDVLCSSCDHKYKVKWWWIGCYISKGERECKCCGANYYHLEADATQDFCSVECKRATAREHKRKNNRIRNRKYGKTHRKRARHYGVYYEPVNKIKVFDRDKWRCNECGIKVQKKDIHADNAAELGHIVPMSKGGAHTYSNCQTECRRCNNEKGDKAIGQQITIFSSVNDDRIGI